MTDGKVVPLFESGFFTCSACDEETDVHILLKKNKDGYFISGFVCAGPGCPEKGTFFPVVNGYLVD